MKLFVSMLAFSLFVSGAMSSILDHPMWDDFEYDIIIYEWPITPINEIYNSFNVLRGKIY